MLRRRCQLYLVTPPGFELAPFTRVVSDALVEGHVAAFQLRMKEASDADILAAGKALKPIVQNAASALVVNDRPDLAAKLDADGVHIGQSDASYAEARSFLGADKIVGITCHNSRDLAYEAAEAGADYVAFGAFYPTQTKEPQHWADPEILEIWQETALTPCVAIGGINLDNAETLVRAGADFLAVSNAVWSHAQGPRAAIAAFNALFDRIAHS
jgi:thiamine-phosphate pyrophosphorylase